MTKKKIRLSKMKQSSEKEPVDTRKTIMKKQALSIKIEEEYPQE